MRWILLLLFSISVVLADEKVYIFANEYKPPKVWTTTDGVHKGILVEILKEVEKELDVKLEIETFPWARSYKMALNHKGGIVGISKNKEREEIFDYNSVALFDDTMILVTKKGKEFKFDHIKDLKGKKIGYCRGCSFGDIFEEAKRYFIPVETDDSREQRLKLVLDGRIDAALLGPGEYALRKISKDSDNLDFEQFTILKKPLVVDPNYVAFSKKQNKKELLNQIDTILLKMIKSGKVNKIIKKVIKESL